MNIRNVSEILEEFARDFTVGDLDRDYFADFVIYNDMGLPLAQALVYDLATPSPKGEEIIWETWGNLCNFLGADPRIEYEDLDDLFGEIEEDDDE